MLNIFILSHEVDYLYVKEFLLHLRYHQDKIKSFTIYDITPSENVSDIIKSRVIKTDVVVFFISSDFLSDEHLYELSNFVIIQLDKNLISLINITVRATLIPDTYKKNRIISLPIVGDLKGSDDRDTIYSTILVILLEKQELIFAKLKIIELQKEIELLKNKSDT